MLLKMVHCCCAEVQPGAPHVLWKIAFWSFSHTFATVDSLSAVEGTDQRSMFSLFMSFHVFFPL